MSENKDDNAPYMLSLTLQSDMAPVRSLCHLKEGNTLIAGSQQALVSRYFLPKDDGDVISMDAFQEGHSHSVSFLLAGKGEVYVTGCKDGVIRIFQGKSLIRSLNGHKGNVSSLSWLEDGILLSGSWDGSARVWNIETGECLQVLPDHENTTVVLGLPNGYIVTGSAGIARNNAIVETKLRIWRKTSDLFEVVKSIPYPSGPIRNLCLIPSSFDLSSDMTDTSEEEILFATCSNDGSVKIWNILGSILYTLDHPGQPMVLSVMVGAKNTIVSTTEEGDLVVWNLKNCLKPLQTIRHSSTVWCSLLLPSGDIVSACQDGSVRCFTQDLTKVCSEKEQREFEESGMRAGKGPSNEEIAKLPRWEMRQVVVGKSEGQVQMFQKDGGTKAIAAQWSQVSSTWIEVGEVLSTRDASSSGTIDGVSYNYVFPIEIETRGGVQTLKIGYNDGENAFVVAQAFIDKYELPQYHLQQIADYIMSRVGQTPMQLGGDSVGQTSTQMDVTPAVKTYKNLPQKYCMTFSTDLKSPEKVLAKIKDLNEEVEDPTVKLSSEDIESIDSVLQTLANTSRYHSSHVSNMELNVLCKTLQNWPSSHSFPIVDILKMCILHPDAASTSRWEYWKLVIDAVLVNCEQASLNNSKGAKAVPLLTMRLLANAFKHTGSAKAARHCLEEVVKCTKGNMLTSNKNTRLAISTLLLNISCSLASESSIIESEKFVNELFDAHLLAINTPAFAESETAISRLLLATGTVAYTLRSQGKLKNNSKLLAAVARTQVVDISEEVIDVMTV